MNLRDIVAFVALAEAGSVNRAALRLHLTQPATTRRVQNFEAALGGAALPNRSTKPPVLTPAGRQALEHCRRILKAVAELETSVSNTGEPTGDLRIGIAHGLGEVVLGTPLERLQRRLPGVRLQVSSNWTSRLIEEESVRRPEVSATGLPSLPRALGLSATQAAPGSACTARGRPAVEPYTGSPTMALRRGPGGDARQPAPTSYYAPSLRSPWRAAGVINSFVDPFVK